MSLRKTSRIWIDPQDFRDLRRMLLLTRRDAAKALDVTPRTVQNWENGGARIPWMAFRMLRLLRGAGLPGKAWEGWTVSGDTLHAPNGKSYTAADLSYLEHVFGMARLWRQMFAASGRQKTVETVIAFPDRKKRPVEAPKPPQAQPQRMMKGQR